MLFLLSRFWIKKITVLSSSIIESYSPVLRPKMCAIPNPVHPAETLSDPAGKDAKRKIILNVGRLTDQKDQETLIRAFARLADDEPDWDLRIVGEGELRNRLEEVVRELNLQERVCLPGITSEIEQEYQAAHIFALPSVYESFGLATAEAMAHGLPTIGFSSCPGTNELIVQGKSGLLVEGETRVDAFAHGLKQLMADEKLRVDLGREGLKTVEQFHPDAIAQIWEDQIRDVLHAR